MQAIGKEAFYESGVREIHIPDRVERDAIVLPRREARLTSSTDFPKRLTPRALLPGLVQSHAVLQTVGVPETWAKD